MKKIFLIFAFLFAANLAWAAKDSAMIHQPKTGVLTDTTSNDGWNDNIWSPEPLPQEKTKKESKQERKEERRQKREENPSNFPRGVAWSSVALLALSIIKIVAQNCK